MDRDAEKMEKDVLELVRKAEDTAMEAGRKWAQAVSELMPLELPIMRQVVKEAFDFTDEVLKLQRQFANNVMKTMSATLRTKPAAHVVRKAQPTTHPRTRTTKVA